MTHYRPISDDQIILLSSQLTFGHTYLLETKSNIEMGKNIHENEMKMCMYGPCERNEIISFINANDSLTIMYNYSIQRF